MYTRLRCSRRQFLGVAGLACGASLLAGCAAQQRTPRPSAEAGLHTIGGTPPGAGLVSAQQPPVGRVVIWGWPAADVAYESFLPDFRKAHPEIEPDIIMMPYADQNLKLLACLAAGTGAPDVAMIPIGEIGKFVFTGGLEDLLREPYEAGKYKAQFVDYKWRQATTPDGRLVALPWDIGPATFFYRRDLFDEAGLPSEPEQVTQLVKDWRGFVEVCERLTDPAKQRWAIDSALAVVSTRFVECNFFDKDWNLVIEGEIANRLLDVAKELRSKGCDSQGAGGEWQIMLQRGTFAMFWSGCWAGGFLKTFLKPADYDWSGLWGVFEVPENPGANFGGSFLTIPEQSQNKLAAWTFVEYALATAEAQNKMFKAVDYMPAYKPAFEDPLYHEGDPFFGGQKTKELWIDIAVNKIGLSFISTPMDAEVGQLFNSYAQQIVDQGLDIEETLAKAREEIESAIAASKSRAIAMKELATK